MNTNKALLLVVTTAILLALTLVFQIYVRLLVPAGILNTLIVGSLVNLCLYVASGTVGWRGSVVISIVAPIVAALMGHLPHPLLVPFVAAGNVVLCLTFELIARGRDKGPLVWSAIGAASVLKFVVLFVIVTLVFVPAILPGLGLKPAVGKALALNFSWPQLVTALVGGIVAIPVFAAVRRALRYPTAGAVKV